MKYPKCSVNVDGGKFGFESLTNGIDVDLEGDLEGEVIVDTVDTVDGLL